MIEVHHLEQSRSHRILWLLEELGQEYEVVSYARDPQTFLAPESLAAIHPLGKSPVVRDGDSVLFESGAILETLAERYGEGRLAPAPGTPEALRHRHWMHYAEGSLMLPLMMKLYLSRLGDGAEGLMPRVHEELERHVGYVESEIEGRDYFVGDALTAADIQLSFPVQLTRMLYGIDSFPNLAKFLDRVASRPAYHRAIERGGAFGLGPAV